MRRSWMSAAVVASGWAVIAPMSARAGDAPASRWLGSAGVVSDYLFRGLSQTDRRPAVQAGVEFDHAGGGYVGGWGSNVSWLADASTSTAPISSSVELDLYAGWRGDVGGGWSWDAGLYRYQYPGSYPRGFTRPHTTEGYAALAWKSVSLKYSYAFTDLFGYAGSRHSGYLDLSWSREFAPGWLLNAHVGHQHVANVPGTSYSDWKLGVTRNFGSGWSLALGYCDTDARRAAYTNARGHYLGGATAVLSVARSF
ncbi:TorF family putative porin [Rhodanobacter denitrificans]|uniref:TorF family putative porin n=1 Tax=Rhodanobacter denitrificans TaxID=666685 RepID=UPI001F1A891F|nr:TorF family putative porin [Rhodanobacter denitrificans]UJJ60033.1 TorF family putative porin [Rhodanobacter denitrificans]